MSKKLLLGASAALIALTSLALNAVERKPQALAHHSPAHGVQELIAQNASPLRIVFPSRSDSADLQTKANRVAEFLSREMGGTPVEAIVGDDTAAVEALRANRADVAFLSSRPALKAEQLANSRLYLAEVRANYSGGHTYRAIWVVPNNSPLRSNNNAQQALTQLRGKKIAFTSPTSGSGFIFPVGELVRLGLVPSRDRLDTFFSQVTYGNNYGGALQAVLRGQVDVATVSEYALNPPYITAEEKARLRVLYAVPGVPAHGVSIDDDVPAAMRDRIINSLIKLNQSANNQMLRDLYNSTQLVRVEHDRHLQPMREALRRAGIEP